MASPDLTEFLRKLGCASIKPHGKWLRATCPLAPWTHAKGSDKHPSFALGVSGDVRGHYGCLACNRKGTVVDLLFTLQTLSGRNYTYLTDYARGLLAPDPDTMAERLKAASYLPAPPRDVAGVAMSAARADTMEVPEVIDESVLRQFRQLSPEASEYLHTVRGLSDTTIRRWGLGWHNARRRIILPVRDISGSLVCLTGRALDAEAKPKFLHSTGFKKELYLFGEHLVVEQVKAFGQPVPRIALVEGHFDAIWIDQCGFPAVALMGTYLSAVQMKKIMAMAASVVIVGDGDKAGWEMNDRLLMQLGSSVPTSVYKLENGRDPDDMTTLEIARLFST